MHLKSPFISYMQTSLHVLKTYQKKMYCKAATQVANVDWPPSASKQQPPTSAAAVAGGGRTAIIQRISPIVLSFFNF